MATTERLPSGKYRGVYYDSGGRKRHTPAVGRMRDAKKAAVDAEAKASRQASANAGTLPGHTTWGEWHPIWWHDRDIEPSTAAAEERLIRVHILPRWEHEEMAPIAQPEVQDWVTHLHKTDGHPASYVRRIYTVFRSSISAAVRKGVLTASPCVGVKLPKVAGRGDGRTYEHDELDAIFSAKKGRLPASYVFAAEFIVETGLRPAEFAGLHRHRIDRRGGWLTVRDTYCGVAKRIKTYPKDEEERAVPLTSRALELLDSWYELHPAAGTSCGLKHQSGRCKSDLLFRQPNSRGPMDVKNFWRVWSRAQERAGIEVPGRPYDLRHTYGTRLADAGVDPWDIAALMGHASLDQSTDYIHRSQGRRMRILGMLGDPAATKLTAVQGEPQVENPPSRPTSVPRSAS